MKWDDPEFDENPEWTEEDFVKARPASEILPPHLAEQLVRSKPAQSIAHVLSAAGMGLASSRFAPFQFRDAA